MTVDHIFPCKEVREMLLPAFALCNGFEGNCGSMRWQPEVGHVPRGFCGASGVPGDVRLILVVAEPGDPHANEIYPPDARPEDKFEAACGYAYASFGTGKDQFHRNIRAILDECWPSLSFHEQFRRTWITESVLCSASIE